MRSLLGLQISRQISDFQEFSPPYKSFHFVYLNWNKNVPDNDLDHMQFLLPPKWGVIRSKVAVKKTLEELNTNIFMSSISRS